MANIIVDTPIRHVRRIQINRPEKLNAIDFDVREEMMVALRQILADREARAIVFGGVGGNLSAGGDLSSMQGLSGGEADARLSHIHKLCRLIFNAGIPVVTCINGVAAGAGFGLSLLGDYIVGEATSRVIVPFLKLGLVPDWGMMQTLPARIGMPAARQIMFESKTVHADQALALGLYDELSEEGEGPARAIEKAEAYSKLPRQAVRLMKEQLRRQVILFDALLEHERESQISCLTGDEFQEGFASFKGKRRADFTKF